MTGLSLSKREREVVEQRMAGKSYDEIGTALGLSEKTVGVHLCNARNKLGHVSIAAMLDALTATDVRP